MSAKDKMLRQYFPTYSVVAGISCVEFQKSLVSWLRTRDTMSVQSRIGTRHTCDGTPCQHPLASFLFFVLFVFLLGLLLKVMVW